MKNPRIQRHINELYARTGYEILNPGGRLVKSRTKSILREIPNESKHLLNIRPVYFN